MAYEVQQTRWDRIIRRVSGSIGPGSRVSETLSELFPVLDVERVPGELLILGGTRLAWGGHSLADDVGNTGKIQLFNPADSGTLVTVTRIVVTIRVGSLRMAIEGSTRLTDAGTPTFRDSRLAIGEQPVAQIFSESTATIISVVNLYEPEAAVPLSLSDENGIAVLGPGTGLTIGPASTNVKITAEFWWRERAAEESELSL